MAGPHALHTLHAELSARGIPLRIIGAHGTVRDLLRADGLAERISGIERGVTLQDLLEADRK